MDSKSLHGKVSEALETAINYTKRLADLGYIDPGNRFMPLNPGTGTYSHLSLDDAAKELAEDENYRQIYFECHPGSDEKGLMDSARSHINLNRVMEKLRRERQLTPEEMDRPCFTRAA